MWSEQQSAGIVSVRRWLIDRSAKQVFRLFGFAGTGKSTLAIEIASYARGPVVYCAFTGKAALVMRSKGCTNASTIHSLIYKAEEQDDGSFKFTLNPNSMAATASLIILDECSMVDDALAQDLCSFGTKILVLGDPGQLPPVRGAGYFTQAKPDVMLTEIHRQAADNPIIRLSMDIRAGKKLVPCTFGDSKIITSRQVDRDEVMSADQILCGTNKTRRGCNARYRKLRGIESAIPVPGERLVCLRNNRERQLLNGGLWKVLSTGMNVTIVEMEVVSQDEPARTKPEKVTVPMPFFEGTEADLDTWFRRRHDEFDYGYALTVHKGQGSQWPNVYLFDESSAFREDRTRHLYTGTTRAAEKITIVV